MIRLLVPVNYKGEIYEPSIVHFDYEYEKKLVESGNATFDIQVEAKQELEKVEGLKEAKTSKKTTKKM